MINQGMYVVAAAGNNGMPIGDVTPASIPDVLTIGSFNQNLEPSAFSNYTGGSDISYTANDVNYGALDGWAPGELIWAANKNGGYGYIAGTSAAAAIASAAIAYNVNSILTEDGLINGNITTENINALYKNSSVFRRDILDLSNPLYSNSVNKCITIFTSSTFPEFYSYIREVRAGVTSNFSIAKPIAVASISSNSVLPEYISISSDGYISINHALIDESYLQLPDLELTYALKNGSISTVIFKCIVVAAQYENVQALHDSDPELFSENDLILSYTLTADEYCADTGPYECADDGCSAIGPPFIRLCRTDVKDDGCFCDPGY
jgi:hypothetical protein